MVGIFTF